MERANLPKYNKKLYQRDPNFIKKIRSFKSSVCLEFSENKVSLSCLCKINKIPTLKTIDYINIDHNWDNKEYIKSIKNLLKKNNISYCNASIILPNSVTLCNNINIPKINKNSIQRYLLKNHSNYSNLSEYQINYQIFDVNNNSINLFYTITPKEIINSYKKLFNKLNLNLIAIDFRAIALYKAYILTQTSKDNAILIDNSSDSSYIIAIINGLCFIYNIDIASKNDIQSQSAIICAKINYLTKVKYKDNIFKKFLLIDSTNQAENLILAIKANLNIEINEFNLLDNEVNIPDNLMISSHVLEQNLSFWTASLGDALNYIGTYFSKKSQDSLDDYQTKNILSNVALAVTMCFSGLILLSYNGYDSYIHLQSDNIILSDKIDHLKNAKKNLASQQIKFHQLNQQLYFYNKFSELKSQIRNNQKLILDLNHYLADNIGNNMWFKEVAFKAPNIVEIKGGSLDDNSVIEFVKILNNSGKFAQIALTDMGAVENFNEYTLENNKHNIFTISGLLPDNKTNANNEANRFLALSDDQ